MSSHCGATFLDRPLDDVLLQEAISIAQGKKHPTLNVRRRGFTEEINAFKSLNIKVEPRSSFIQDLVSDFTCLDLTKTYPQLMDEFETMVEFSHKSFLAGLAEHFPSATKSNALTSALNKFPDCKDYVLLKRLTVIRSLLEGFVLATAKPSITPEEDLPPGVQQQIN